MTEMTMTPPSPGLRAFVHDSNQVTKVELAFQPGDELHVSDDVADQLAAASTHFKPAASKVTRARPVDAGPEGQTLTVDEVRAAEQDEAGEAEVEPPAAARRRGRKASED